MGWGGINSVWTSASAALQQAKSVVDEQVKHLPGNEQAKKWSEGVMGYVNTEHLEKLGMIVFFRNFISSIRSSRSGVQERWAINFNRYH